MAATRTFVLALLVLGGLLLAGTGATLLSDRALFSASRYLIGLFTTYRLELDAPALDRRAGVFRAKGVRLYQQGQDGPPMLAVQSLKLDHLFPLLRKGDLKATVVSADSVQLYVDATDGTEDPVPADWLRQTRWLPQALDVGVVHGITRARDLRIVPLREIHGRWKDAELFAVEGSAHLADKTLQLALTLAAVKERSLKLTASIAAPANGSLLELDGRLTANDDKLDYRFALAGDYRRVENLLAILEDDAYGFAGRLRLRGELRGDLDAAELTVEMLSLNNAPRYDFSADGRLRWRYGEPVTMELAAQGALADLGPFADLLGTDLSELGQVDAALSLDGNLRRPRVRDFEFTSRSATGLSLTLAPTDQDVFLGQQSAAGIELELHASAAAATALEPWVVMPMATGPWELNATIRRESNFLSVRALDLAVRDLAGGRLQASGVIDRVVATAAEGQRYQGLDLAITATGLELGALAGAGDRSFPAPLAGTVSLTATVAGDDGALAARAIDATVAAFGGTTRIKGRMERLEQLEGAELHFAAGGLDAARLADTVFTPVADILRGGRVGGSFLLREAAAGWRVDDLELTLDGAERIDLSLTGTFEQLTLNPRAQLVARYRLKRSAGASGIALPPGDGTAVLDLTPQRQLIGLHALLGETDLTSLVRIARTPDGAIAGLEAEVRAPRLHLPDLARVRARQALLATELEATQEAVPGPGEQLFAGMPGYPVELRLELGAISGSNTRLSNFVIALHGKDRRFTLDQFDVDYAGGAVELRGVADFSGDRAALSLAGEAYRLPVTALAEDLGYGGEIEGTLSLRGGLTSEARSLETLVANLNGTLAGAVADGYVEGAALDILMTDLFSWLLLGGVLQNNTNFDCGMAQFLVTGGVARSEDIYLATRHMIAQGTATLDFPGHQVDVRIDPRARSRQVQIPSSVRIRGPMSNPSIQPSPIAATVDASARLLFMIPELGLKLLGIQPDREAVAAPCAGVGAGPEENAS